MSAFKHALIIPIYGVLQPDCIVRLRSFVRHGYFVVVVNNNPNRSSTNCVVATAVVHHHNRFGLAGGFNAGVAYAIESGAESITLLDQDSVISPDSLACLAQACLHGQVVGPRVVDVDRSSVHTSSSSRARMLISSGTTFLSSTWIQIGPFLEWMEIDYIDHEWCFRANTYGVHLSVIQQATLLQTFGLRHPNRFAHCLGLQLYSPYRRAIALRNLRWLLVQRYVPFDIRLKEFLKMLLKPFIWLTVEPHRRRCFGVLWLGLTAPLNKPFPRSRLEQIL